MKQKDFVRTKESTGSQISVNMCVYLFIYLSGGGGWWVVGGLSSVPSQTPGISTCHQKCCTARQEWQWSALWALDPAFSSPPNSPAGPLSPFDKMRRHGVSWSLCLTHSLNLCFTFRHLPEPSSLPPSSSSSTPSFPSLISSKSCSFFLSFVSWFFISLSCFSAHPFAPWHSSSIKAFFFPSPLSFPPWTGGSWVVGIKIEQVVNTCLLSQIMEHLFDRPAFVASKEPFWAVLQRATGHPAEQWCHIFLSALYTLDFSFDSRSWQPKVSSNRTFLCNVSLKGKKIWEDWWKGDARKMNPRACMEECVMCSCAWCALFEQKCQHETWEWPDSFFISL